MKVTAVALLCLSSCTAHNVRVHEKETKHEEEIETKTATKRASDYLNLKHTYDDFEPVVQNICNEEKTFMFDGCEISYEFEDLDTTEYEHVFETDCGEYDIVITFDLEDGLPDHANKVSGYSEHWAELIHVPELEDEGEEGCLFVEVSSLDIDPAKVEEDYLQHPRKLLEADSSKRSFFAGQNDFFPIEKSERRELNSCSSYNVIKLGLIFDAAFCQQVGGYEGNAHAVLHSVIATMNQWYMASPLCFYVYSTYIGGTCSYSHDPIQGVLQRAVNFCSSDGDLTDTFAAHVNGQLHGGSDAMHLVFGGSHGHLQDAAGCAFGGTLCTWHAVGASNFAHWYTQHDMAVLLAHELGHTLSLADFYPQDQTYIMGDGSAGFKYDRMWKMKNFVTQRSQQIPGCTAMGYA